MEQLNINIVKNSTYTLDEIFNIYKEVFPTNKQWSVILKLREGVLNFFSLKTILKKSIVYYDTSNSRIVVFSSEKQIFDFVGKESFKEEEGYGIVYGYTTDTNYVTNYLVLKTSGIDYSTTLTITYNDVQIKYWMILTEK